MSRCRVHIQALRCFHARFLRRLKAFTEGLGFGDDPLGLANAAPGTSVGAVGVALDFTENVFTPVGFWQSLDRFDVNVQPLTRDSVSVDWLVQLNGMKDGHVVEADQIRGFEQGEHAIARDYDGNAFGNNASVVDGQDWSGALWVKGNYYEFNTIIQVNILWDNDKITFEDFQSANGTPGGLSIHPGQHQQNTAIIGVAIMILRRVVRTPRVGRSFGHHLIAGGAPKSSSAIQSPHRRYGLCNFNVDHRWRRARLRSPFAASIPRPLRRNTRPSAPTTKTWSECPVGSSEEQGKSSMSTATITSSHHRPLNYLDA